MTTINTIHNFITKHKLISLGKTVIIGLSGGPDSVFLLHVLAQLRKQLDIKLTAAHLDHEWRATSAQDALWCKQLAESLNIPFVSQKISDLEHGVINNGSKEAYAREIRRFFFRDVAQKYNADVVALAHHAHDQQETFFIRLARGATLSGLCGIKVKDGIFIRPLLSLSKDGILSYLHENNIEYRIDETNESENFLRNRIRLNLMPQLDQVDPRMKTNLLRSMEHLQETENYLQEQTLAVFDTLVEQLDDTLALNIQAFLNTHPYLQKRILLHFLISNKAPFTPTEALFDEIMRFLKNNRSSTHAIHPQWSLEKKQNLLIIVSA